VISASTCVACGGAILSAGDAQAECAACHPPKRGRGRPSLGSTVFTIRATGGRWADLDARAEAAGVTRRVLVDRLLWPDPTG